VQARLDREDISVRGQGENYKGQTGRGRVLFLLAERAGLVYLVEGSFWSIWFFRMNFRSG